MVGGIFAVLDDIAILLDDAAVMSKVAAKKTAAILGDDVAVSAEKATGFRASRELPVLWAITKGSFLNKLIILPLAFLLSAYAPFMIVPILLLGGVYLSYEGVEKIYDTFFHTHEESHEIEELTKEEFLVREKLKVKSAIKMDFILSIEIVMIALGTVATQVLAVQIMVVSLIAFLATIGVYGFVALLVRMDDVGFYLIEKAEQKPSSLSSLKRKIGEVLVASLPKVIRLLGVVGTIAMLLVGGGMFLHNIEAIHHLFISVPSMLSELILGLIIGAVALSVELIFKKIKGE